MANKRVLPSDSILEKWLDDGLSLEDIRQRVLEQTGYLPGKSTVSAALSRAGLTSRVRYDDVIPWKRISVDHNQHYILHQLRMAARMKRGLPVSEGDQRRFKHWKSQLDEANAIVCYDIDSVEGFYYDTRRPGERGLARP